MNKGFTLAELLGVVVILSVLSLIAVTTVDTKLKEGRTKTCLAQQTNIIEGAKAWTIDNPNVSNNTKLYVKSDLEAGGYIEDNLINPMTDKVYTDSTYVLVNVSGYNYTYKVEYISEEGC